MNSTPVINHASTLRLRRMGINTHQEPVVYMREDCHICRAEGFTAHSRVLITTSSKSIIATLNMVSGDFLILEEAGLSEAAWRLLAPQEGETAHFSHAPALDSLSHLRSKVYGKSLEEGAYQEIMRDITAGFYSDVELSSFVTACAGSRMTHDEIFYLTRAMVQAGDQLKWDNGPIVDKHSVGGLPGNRTTLLIVPIVTCLGLTMPKTSSRAITSPAGTADTMEVLAPVDLSLPQMRKVVEQEGGCILWGGAVHLSPADDTLIRIERALDLDSEGQLVASVLSKKAAAGSTHLVLDVPVGPTAKVRSAEEAVKLIKVLEMIGSRLGMKLQAVMTDGSQPVGRGIGPALEAMDVLSILRGDPQAPQDLRRRALVLAGALLELSGKVDVGRGFETAESILNDGRALKKFRAICEAQGGMREPPRADFSYVLEAKSPGQVAQIDNRKLARVAKFAGAPAAPAAGVEIHVRLGDRVEKGQPLLSIFAETRGELAYSFDYLSAHLNLIDVKV